uniref:Tyrosine-protein phosphatase domain-containing protein n=1 Tax=Parastrongyloides trichosuri TaxID=131310 RepID=A0A0N5A7B5_PARTI
MRISIIHSIIQLLSISATSWSGPAKRDKFFPSAPSTIPKGDISYSLSHSSVSDVIMVKCPGKSYKFAGSNNLRDFNMNPMFRYPIGTERLKDSQYVWSAIIKKDTKNQNLKIHCGFYLYFDKNGTFLRNVNWIINIIWKNKKDMNKNMEYKQPHEIITTESMKAKCRKEISKLTTISKKSNGELVSSNRRIEISNMRTKQVIYFFDKAKVTDTGELLEPCGIVKVYNTPPSIKILRHKKIDAKNDSIVDVIYSNSPKKRRYKIKLETTALFDYKNFYAEEKVIVQRMKFRNGKVEPLDKKKFEILNNLDVTEYEIFEFKYSSLWEGGKYKEVKNIIFFGPKNEDPNTIHETINIIQNDRSIKGNCSADRLSYGYLISIRFNNITTEINDFKSENQVINNITKSGKLFFHTMINRTNYELECIYQTPDMKVIIHKNFLGMHKQKFFTNKKVQLDFRNKTTLKKKNYNDISKKSFITKITQRLGAPIFYIICVIIGICIALICFFSYWFLLRKMVCKSYEKMKKRRRYANIFHFWNTVNSQSLKEYSKMATDDKYVSEKVKTIKIIKHLESEDSNIDSADNLFSSTLINSYKLINGIIKAHYIKSVSPARTYIISDGPRKHAIGEFFKMLYLEDVAVVVAILYKDFNNANENAKDVRYWSDKSPVVYGSLTVEPIKDKNNKSSTNARFCFRISNKSEIPKEVTIYHVSDWREYDLPSTTKYLTELYKSVTECAGSRTILVHNFQSVGPRVFIFTYFCCIFERMIKDGTTDNPMEIIKEVRENYFGGNITSMEFGYIIAALVNYFFEKGYLFGSESTKLKFTEDFETYMYENRIAISNVSDEFTELVKFLWAYDRLKIAELINQCKRVQLDPLDILDQKCQRHLMVNQSENRVKLRYPGVYCLDNAAVYLSNFSQDDIRSFIHANQMIYDMGEGKKRKLIMCQAPVPETLGDMLDVLYYYKVGIIVILVNPEELDTKPPKWTRYLPHKERVFRAGDYNVIKMGYKVADSNHISEMDCRIFSNDDTSQYNYFKVYHYEAWPDACVPKKTDDVLKLIKRVMSDPNSERNIVIHCSAGIGRTGTFALALLMIDTIYSNGWFNPIKSLDFLRKHRHRAVQTDSQFAFAIALVLDYFRKDIENFDKKLLSNFKELLKIYYN